MAGGERPWERFIDITGNEPGGHVMSMDGALGELAVGASMSKTG